MTYRFEICVTCLAEKRQHGELNLRRRMLAHSLAADASLQSKTYTADDTQTYGVLVTEFPNSPRLWSQRSPPLKGLQCSPSVSMVGAEACHLKRWIAQWRMREPSRHLRP